MTERESIVAESAPSGAARRNTGPWAHRVAFGVFTVVLGVLCYWLISFVLSDVSDRPTPDYSAIEQEMLDESLVADSKDIDAKLASNARSIADERQRQQVLRESTAEAQRTMNQLLDFQRLALDKGVNPTPEEQKALADSQQLFLNNQQQFQSLNETVTQLEETQRELDARRRSVDERLVEARKPVQEEFDRQWETYRWQTAAIKLAVLLPLLVLAAFAWQKLRGTLYVPLAYAFDAAVALHLILVMHEYFPQRYFRYLLIGAALVAVLRILIFLVRQVAKPKTDWLVRQFREAYEKFVCPVCSFPIRRNALAQSAWARGPTSPAAMLPSLPVVGAKDEPYTCPCCAVTLFEECPQCHGLRHALLPACEHCGATKTAEEISLAARA